MSTRRSCRSASAALSHPSPDLDQKCSIDGLRSKVSDTARLWVLRKHHLRSISSVHAPGSCWCKNRYVLAIWSPDRARRGSCSQPSSLRLPNRIAVLFVRIVPSICTAGLSHVELSTCDEVSSRPPARTARSARLADCGALNSQMRHEHPGDRTRERSIAK